MKRRNFFGALIGLVVAPFAVKAASKRDRLIEAVDRHDFQPPLKRVFIDWWTVVEEKAEGYELSAPDGIGYWLRPPVGKIRYRWDHGEWQVKEGPLPLQLENGVELVQYRERAAIMLANKSTSVCTAVCFGNPDVEVSCDWIPPHPWPVGCSALAFQSEVAGKIVRNGVEGE